MKPGVIKNITWSFFFLLITSITFAQPVRKQVQAFRIHDPVKIDGILDEPMWRNAKEANDFVQFTPYNSKQPSQPTTVKILYDNRAIYFGAIMYDSSPDSILTELGTRDQGDINADMFSVDLSPYNDGLNAVEFKVSASGVQIDVKHAPDFRDDSWDAVWKSAVRITDIGWIAEIEIPYSAIRFPKEDIQVWGVNFWRSIKRRHEWSTWNYIDNKLDGVLNQSGELIGLKNINPPLRLSFVPYIATYAEKKPENKNWSYAYNYGLDLKYGINESFTLDMTLIPDFGQVQSDERIIDLSPFEIYYEEKRPFFTEGTELFDKGGVFYSRRIGSTPSGFSDVESGYDDKNIIKNPDEAQLINATKISGRNKKGLGIGLFNAITSNTYAKVRDSSGKEKKILTEPATNYNMLVFDQSLKNNSFISVYNTNVYRGKNDYTANVSGSEFRFTDKNNMFSARGLCNISQKYYPDNKPEFGFKYHAEIGKISGNFRFYLWENTESDTYDPNDMGFLRNNNEFSNGLNLCYNIYDPFWKLMDWYNKFYARLDYLYAPRKYSSFNLGLHSRATTKNYTTIGFHYDVAPVEIHDYFEARSPGRMVRYPSHQSFSLFVSPDYKKRFVIDIWGEISKAFKYNMYGYELSIEPRFRVNNKLFFTFEFEYEIKNNDYGYVTDSTNHNEQVIIFGKRDVRDIINTFETSYVFTNKIGLSFQLRHYWITVKYKDFYDLQDDGYLVENNYSAPHNFSFNAFNIDMVFTWEFAPGSELLFIWKYSIYEESDKIHGNYFNDVRKTLDSPATNSFSIKLLYYLDYQYFKRKSNS